MIQHQRPSVYPFDTNMHFLQHSITFQYLFRFLGTAYVCPNFLYSFTWALEIRCFRVYLPTISLFKFSCFIAHPWDLCSQVFCGLIEASRTTCKQWYVSSCSASRYTHHDQYWSMLDILDQRDGFGSNSSTSCFFEPQHFWSLEWFLIHFDHVSSIFGNHWPAPRAVATPKSATRWGVGLVARRGWDGDLALAE